MYSRISFESCLLVALGAFLTCCFEFSFPRNWRDLYGNVTPEESEEAHHLHFDGIRFIFRPYPVKFEVGMEDLLELLIGSFVLTWAKGKYDARQEEKALREQPVSLAVDRFNIGLNSESRSGFFELRTLCETKTSAVLPFPAQIRELVDLCSKMKSTDEDPFVRATDEIMLKQLKRTLQNHVSSMFYLGHVARDMGDESTSEEEYLFVLTFETTDTAVAERKLRLLLIKKTTLEGLGREPKLNSQLPDDAKAYYTDRFENLLKFRSLLKGPNNPDAKFLVHGDVKISIAINRQSRVATRSSTAAARC